MEGKTDECIALFLYSYEGEASSYPVSFWAWYVAVNHHLTFAFSEAKV